MPETIKPRLITGLLLYILKGIFIAAASAMLTVTLQAGETEQSDVAILIHAGHSNMPNKVIAYHGSKQSFLETWDGIDVKLWRRADTSQQWQVMRHMKNLQGGWTHADDDDVIVLM